MKAIRIPCKLSARFLKAGSAIAMGVNVRFARRFDKAEKGGYNYLKR